jgi:plastocyanin domain-containing protein
MCWWLTKTKPVNVIEPLPVEEQEVSQTFIGGLRMEQLSLIKRPEPIRIPKPTRKH